MKTVNLDSFDRKILNRLQHDCKITNVRLADEVGLSPPACLRRVKRLREEGVIESEVAILSPTIVGLPINVIVEVEMEQARNDLYYDFIKMMNAAPEVSQCYKVTGEIDFILIVSVANMQSYEDFVQRTLFASNNLRKYRTLISMKREKFETAIQL